MSHSCVYFCLHPIHYRYGLRVDINIVVVAVFTFLDLLIYLFPSCFIISMTFSTVFVYFNKNCTPHRLICDTHKTKLNVTSNLQKDCTLTVIYHFQHNFEYQYFPNSRSGLPPGSLFTEGTHSITYTARDSDGLTATCVVTFTVRGK